MPSRPNSRARAGKRLQASLALALLICLLLGATACKKRAVQAAPPLVVVPSTLPAETGPETPPQETKPEPGPESAPAPALVVPPPRPAPAKPSPGAKPPATPEPVPEPVPPRPAPPQISPRLSTAEQAEYQRKTKQAVAVAERNLQSAYGKQLTAAQLDLVEKIRGFLAQAREAMRATDWVRASNLAQKAQVLSVELVNSL